MPGIKTPLVDHVPTIVNGLILLCLLGTTQGCGESQQDLFMKHAKRDRAATPAAESEPATPAAPDPQTTPQQVATTSTQPITAASVNPERKSVTVEPVETKSEDPENLADVFGITPIGERQPEHELTVAERRRKSFKNLQKISDALFAYLGEKGRFPLSYRTAPGGIPSLSWRVELLPYLGYEELYNRFDFGRAWNMQPNKDLLQYIPDEFVSPERFDTKTNYLLPAAEPFIFGENRAISPSRIDDGPENTILLLEVNNEHAVNWTEPKDFQPKSVMTMGAYFGNVRVDGTFALWANGFPTLLEKSLTDKQLFEAMSYKQNDALRGSAIHRAITVEEAEEDTTTADSLSDQLATTDLAVPPIPAGLRPQLLVPEESVAREPVPLAAQLSEAQVKLRTIFKDQLGEAKKPDDKAKLATELLTTADTMEADPAGAYTLQQAAMRLAIDASDADILIKAIDQRVARFEVDSFDENLKWIQAFGQATASRDASVVKGDPILERAIAVIYAGIREDEYMLASSVARIANRFTSTSREDKVARLLTRLRTQLGVAKREYDKSVDDLHQFRINPDDHDAGAAFGSFLCFIKGDWQTGLKLIADGTGSDLVEVARMDLRGASDASDQVAIGDAWWELSLRGSGAYQQGAQDRAVMWYTQALERLPESLDRIHVKNRLQEADESDGRSPLALCEQLADEIGTQLGQSLTSIAAKGGRAARRNNDDDD